MPLLTSRLSRRLHSFPKTTRITPQRRFMHALMLLGFLGASDSRAACSRVITVPVSAIGQSVIISEGSISGIYPELLRGLEGKEGCQFAISAVPRARLELMFETGKADLLVPATKTPKRDELGFFVPLVQSRATLISLHSDRAGIKSVSELLERKALRVSLVRGYDYGPVYLDMLAQLTAQGRVTLEPDPTAVARALKAGMADVTLMAPTILSGAIKDDPRVRDIGERLRIEALAELPWGESGVYLSRATLTPDDVNTLRDLLTRASQSSAMWRSFQRYYDPAVLKMGIKPK